MKGISLRAQSAALIGLASALILSLYSCPLGGFGNTGSIILNIESTLDENAQTSQDTQGKGIVGIPLKIVSWLIEGDGPEEESFSETLSDDGTATLRKDGLVAGTWTITATGKNSEGAAIVTGSDTIVVEKGSITYAGISCAGVQGTGSLSVRITWPLSSIKQPEIKAYVSFNDIVRPSRDLDFPIAITGTSAAGTLTGIPSGPIMLELFIGDEFGEGKIVWTSMEVVHIVAGETIEGTWTLVANDIDSIGQGDVDINVVANIPQPVDVQLTLKSTASSDAGSIFTVAGTATPGISEYTLYVDSQFYMYGYSLPADWKIGPGLSAGPHFLTLVCREGQNYGSATLKITQMAEGIQKGTALAWGYSYYLTRFQGPDSPVPVQISGLPQGIPKLVEAGAYHAMAVTADGELWTWGENSSYQCGHDTDQHIVWTPGKPLPGIPVSLVAAGVYHSLAYTE
ncbi:MAG TPA: RCC1 domain-containing protein, partial [Rectinemataceae bacterium]